MELGQPSFMQASAAVQYGKIKINVCTRTLCKAAQQLLGIAVSDFIKQHAIEVQAIKVGQGSRYIAPRHIAPEQQGGSSNGRGMRSLRSVHIDPPKHGPVPAGGEALGIPAAKTAHAFGYH